MGGAHRRRRGVVPDSIVVGADGDVVSDGTGAVDGSVDAAAPEA